MKNGLKKLQQEGYNWLYDIDFTDKEIESYTKLLDKKLAYSKDQKEETMLENAKNMLQYYKYNNLQDIYNKINEHLNKIDNSLNQYNSETDTYLNKKENHQWIANRINALNHKVSCIKAAIYPHF